MANYSIDYYQCSDKGLMLPFTNEYTWNKGVRAFLYLIGMLWCFQGVAIACNTFVCGIEHITSMTKRISTFNLDGSGIKVIHVKVWNDTVANLTLLAFGTSAPEILLSVIEICGHNFMAGELGPGTIVGSAAFNLFVITAICIVSVPHREIRKIQNPMVFVITSAFGIFAYLWLVLVLVVITPEVVELWEAVVTLLLFPVLVLLAYAADKRRFWGEGKISSEVEIGFNLNNNEGVKVSAKIIQIARELVRGRTITEDDTANIVAATIAENIPKPSRWYRVQATRVANGGELLVPKSRRTFRELVQIANSQMHDNRTLQQISANGNISGPSSQITHHDIQPGKAIVEFSAASSAVLENEGQVRIAVKRHGDVSQETTIGLETIDGTAKAKKDYRSVKQTVSFGPGEVSKDIKIDIIDDNDWEPDEFFLVKLFHLPSGSTNEEVIIGHQSINKVTIVDDDEPGKIEFSLPSYVVKESCGSAQLVINRVNGADGEVEVTWTTQDLSAIDGHQYVACRSTETFKHGETSKIIYVDIYGISECQFEPNFQVQLSRPTGGAELGKIPKTIVTIIKDEDFNNMLSRVATKTQKNLDGFRLDASTWSQQFRLAMNVNGGGLDEATSIDYINHFLAFFWKVLFAFIPPPTFCGGWLTFSFSLAFIGLLTGIISDLASIFGCLVGLSEYVTAITFVALGTSMPDVFASRAAAINEHSADMSIGNINGSNSVNVFLGMGLPWLLAASYWQSKGKQFEYPTGSLAMSVTVFTVSAAVLIGLLICRRKFSVFGKAELGGPTIPKYLSACLAFLLYIIYIILSSLKAQKVIHTIF